MNNIASENLLNQEKSKREIQGTVVSNKMDKTVVIEIQRRVRHPKYEKYITRHSKLYAHDELNECKIGDVVLVQQSRPISKKKNWRVVGIVTKK